MFKRRSLLLSALFAANILAFLLPSVTLSEENPTGSAGEYKVINVKSIIRMDARKEKEFKDFFVNFGTADGATVGRKMKVHREVIKRSEIEGITDKRVNIPIGVLEIILVEDDVSVSRLISVEKRDDNPLAVYDTVMINDIAVPMKKEVKKKKEVITLPDNILFDFDKHNLKKGAKGALSEIAVKIRSGNFKRIDIATHTDSIGSDKYNAALSKRRAKSILNYFTKVAGLPTSLFTTSGYGESRPVSTNKTKFGRQKNRRGEITFFNK